MQIPIGQFGFSAPDPVDRSPITRATDRLGQIIAGPVAEAAQKIQLSRDAWQLADATAKATGELNGARGALDADEDFDTHSTRFLDKAKEISERYVGTLSGPAARVFKDDFERMAQSTGVQVAIDAQKLKSQKVRTEIGNTLFDMSQLTGTDPQMDDALRAQARLAVNTSADAGNLTFAERAGLLNKFDTDASEAAIRRDMLSDPEGAELKLASGAYPRLSGEAQALWAQRVSSAAYAQQQRRITEEGRAAQLSEKAKKELQDDLSKQGDTLLANNQMTPRWIEAHSDDLSPEDKRYFYNKLTGGAGEGPRDANSYADLRDKAGRGEDIRDDARAALHSGAIRATDYDRLLAEVESERPGWYKRGSSYIGMMSGYSELNPDPTAAQSKATMLDQWGDWAADHPKASDREAQAAYQDVVSQNALVQMSGLPMPRFAAGSRLNLNIEETEAATVKAYTEKRIDAAEFQRQATLLEKWRQATHPQTPSKP